MSSQTWVVTGAGRGLGKGFVVALLQRRNTRVVAALRNPHSDDAKHLELLPAASGSKLVLVKIDSESDQDPFDAMDTLQNEHGVTVIDAVIANAAMVSTPATTDKMTADDFRKNFQVNTLAPLLLFQAAWPMLQKSSNPRFIGISSCLATIGKMEEWRWPMGIYGTTKSAMNFLLRKMHFEYENLVAFAVHPGWVQTDSGNNAAKAMGREQAPDTVEDSANSILNMADMASKSHISGTFQFYGRGEYIW